jgi:hypothetical protein
MTTFSFIVGVAVAAVAPQMMVPGLVVLEAYRLTAAQKPAVLLATPTTPPWLVEVESGFEYAIGYYIGNAAMTYLFGAQ